MAVAKPTIHNDDRDDHGDLIYDHHSHKWSSPGVIIPIIAGVGLFILALFLLTAFTRRRRRSYVAYPDRTGLSTGPPVPVAPRKASEAPESMTVEGHQNLDYEAGYVEEHYRHEAESPMNSPHPPPVYASNFAPNYGERYYPYHDNVNVYNQGGGTFRASPDAYGPGYGYGGYK